MCLNGWNMTPQATVQLDARDVVWRPPLYKHFISSDLLLQVLSLRTSNYATISGEHHNLAHASGPFTGMEVPVYVNEKRSWLVTDIKHYAKRQDIMDFLEKEYPTEYDTKRKRKVQNYNVDVCSLECMSRKSC